MMRFTGFIIAAAVVSGIVGANRLAQLLLSIGFFVAAIYLMNTLFPSWPHDFFGIN